MRTIKSWQKYFEMELTVRGLERRKRGDVLVSKLRSGDQVELNNGKRVDIEKMKDPDVDGSWADVDTAVSNLTDDSGSYDPDKAGEYLKRRNRLTKVFLDEDDGEVYTLANFKKNADFGSRGSGLRIREHESIQALFLAKRLADGVDIPSGVESVEEIMHSFSEKINGSSNIVLQGEVPFEVRFAAGFGLKNEVVDYYMSDPAWVSTFSKVPNMLAKYTVVGSDGSRSKLIPEGRPYTIFHISRKDAGSVPAALISTYNRIGNEAGFSVDYSKYNPADVYMVDSDNIEEVLSGIESCKDILELNTVCNALFDTRMLIPISLKRSGPADDDTSIIVNATDEMDVPRFEVRRIFVSDDASKGIGTKIVTMSKWSDNGKEINTFRNLSIDSPNTGMNVNVDGEIDGKWARHGKISLAWMKRFIEDSEHYATLLDYLESDPINRFEELNRMDVADLESMLSDISTDIRSMEVGLHVDVVTSTRGRSNEGEDRKRKLISKIQSMQVVRALVVIDHNDRSEKSREIDKVVSNMMLYALSIRNPNFSSPRYVRVVES